MRGDAHSEREQSEGERNEASIVNDEAVSKASDRLDVVENLTLGAYCSHPPGSIRKYLEATLLDPFIWFEILVELR